MTKEENDVVEKVKTSIGVVLDALDELYSYCSWSLLVKNRSDDTMIVKCSNHEDDTWEFFGRLHAIASSQILEKIKKAESTTKH